MNPRDRQIYISTRLNRRLYWLTQLDPLPANLQVSEGKFLTRDEIGEKLLMEKIEQDFPNIGSLEKRLDALSTQLINELLNPTSKYPWIEK